MTEDRTSNDVDTVETETVESNTQPTQEQIEEFFKDVDETSAEIMKLFEGKDITMAIETLSKVVSIIGDFTNNNKMNLLEAMAKIIHQRYPDQHPLVRIITTETGLLSGINFKDDKLYIGENVDEDKLKENDITEIDLKTFTVVKNDCDIEDDKLEKIIAAFKEGYSKFKEEFKEAQKRAAEAKRKEAEEIEKAVQELGDKVEDTEILEVEDNGVEEHA